MAQLKGSLASSILSREEQLAQLREQMQNLQEQQKVIARHIDILEQNERQSTFDRDLPNIKPKQI
jgi:cell division protein FtsB